jgi:hypothetical protein
MTVEIIIEELLAIGSILLPYAHIINLNVGAYYIVHNYSPSPNEGYYYSPVSTGFETQNEAIEWFEGITGTVYDDECQYIAIPMSNNKEEDIVIPSL